MTVVLITGCSSGFGLLAALELARRGDRVFASMRDPARDAALKARAQEDGLDIETLQLDVRDPSSVQQAVAHVHHTAGRIDALVNNAGVGRLGPLEEFDDDELAAVFETNVYGVHRVTREVLPVMRAQGEGVMVNVSSVGGLVAAPFFAVYSASKFALEAMTEALGSELTPLGIRVISICPGPYDTEIAAKGEAPPARHGPDSPYKAEYETVLGRHLAAMKAADKPEEVATAIAHAIHDPATPARVIVPALYEFVAAARGQTPEAELRKALRANYGLEG